MSKSPIKSLTLASAVAMTLAIPVETQAAVDMYLKIDDIEGESTDSKHDKWIDVLSWSWGLSKDKKGKACVQDLTISKSMDLASMDLSQAISVGRKFRSSELVVRSVSNAPLEYLRYEMTNVMVTSYSTGGGASEDRPTESVTLNFEELVSTYMTRDSAGAAGESRTAFIVGDKCK